VTVSANGGHVEDLRGSRPATWLGSECGSRVPRETCEYLVDRALRSTRSGQPRFNELLEYHQKAHSRCGRWEGGRRKELVPVVVELEGAGKWPHWVRPEDTRAASGGGSEWVHILVHFDPLINQRKGLQLYSTTNTRFGLRFEVQARFRLLSHAGVGWEEGGGGGEQKSFAASI